MQKKMLKRVFALICVVSLLITNGNIRMLEASAETTVEFANYRVITPSTFGIEDTTFETAGNVSTPTDQRKNMSVNKVKFCANIAFSPSGNNTVKYLENSSGTGIQLAFYPNTLKYPVLHNYLTSGKMYAGGSFVNGTYQGGADVPAYSGENRHYTLDGALPATTENGNHPFHNNREFTLWFTTELVDFDGDNKIDDLKLGVWFNQKLYKDIYFYIVDCAETYVGCVDATAIHSIKSPIIEDPFADFQVIAPSTLGIENTTFETAGNVSTPTDQRTNMLVNKVKFCANIAFDPSGTNNIEYLENTSGTGIQLAFYPNNQKYPVLHNYLTSGKMYAGGSFVNGTYQGGADVPAYSGVNRHYILQDALPATAENGNHPFHNNREFTLWFTTELVDFDGDGSTDDLKLGVWFNETLYKDIYFYIVDCVETYVGCVEATAIHSIKSPIIEDPFADFRVIAPSTLGIKDTAFETAGNVSTPTDQRTSMSVDKVKFCANIAFSPSGTNNVEYLENTSGTGIQLAFYPNNQKYPVLHNYLTSGKMYAGGSFVNGTYQSGVSVPAYSGENRHYILDGALPATAENSNHPFHNNLEFTLWFTTELVDFDGDNKIDDLKLGVWFNETLYKNIYFYIIDCAEEYVGSIDATSIHSIKSPIIEDPFEDFRVIAPSTLGIKDTAFETAGNVSTPTNKKTNMLVDKVKFCANIAFDPSGTNNIEYLENTSGTGIQLAFYPNNQKYPVLHNYLTSGKMYAGGSFVNGEYQIGDVEVPAYSGVNRHYILQDAIPATAENGNHPFHNNREFTLWFTTELVDFDGDNKIDDLKLGVWFNETLYKDIYFYIVDCAETYVGCVEATAIHSISSPYIEETVVEGPELPEITFSDFNVFDDTYGWNNDTIAINGYYPGGVANKTFVGTVNFSKQEQTHINIGGVDHGWQGVKLYTKGTEAVKLYLRESNSVFEDILIDENISEHVPLDKNVEIKLSFEVTDLDGDEDGADDVRFWLCLGGELYNNAPIWEQVDYAKKLGNYLGIYSSSQGSSVTVASKELEVIPDEIVYDLTEHAYPLGDGDIWVNGEKATVSELTQPGEYEICTGAEGNVIKKLVIYMSGDAHADAVLDVRDLVATIKAKGGIELGSKSAKLGADADGNGTIEESDVATVRDKLLVNKEEETNAVSFEFLGKDVMPIGGFYGPYVGREDNGMEFPDYVTAEYFDKIKAANINLITYTPMDYVNSRDSVKTCLELGEEKGIGIFVNDEYLIGRTGSNNISSAVLKQQIGYYSVYESFCGLFVADEPNGTSYQPNSNNDFVSKYGELALDLQYDLGHTCYMNMFPAMDLDGDGSFEESERQAYEEYVNEFCETLHPKVLMWDKYPISNANGPSTAGYQSYLYNLGLMRKNADKYDVPFWAYVQAGGQWNDEKDYFNSTSYYPNNGQFDWNVNTSLAFGAQGIQYFPLIQPIHFAYAGTEVEKGWDFKRNGLIAADGSTTQWYDYAQAINKHIGVIDEVLMNAKHKGILLNASDEGTKDSVAIESVLDHMSLVEDALVLGKGTDREWNDTGYSEGTSLSWNEISNVDGEAMIGCFSYQGKAAYYVVNYNMNSEQSIKMEFSKDCEFTVMQNATRTISSGTSMELAMNPGEGVLVIVE